MAGFMFGVIASPLNTVNRLWTTKFMPAEIQSWISGGGLNLRIFSLKFLYQEHMFFRNCWSKSNDGYDLALYLGTKLYLPPHSTQDYFLWWDTDLTKYNNEDYYRLHPVKALCARNVIFVRSQKNGNNHKTRKVFIKPPANLTSQWKFQTDWYDFPLFAWGIALINWDMPFQKGPGFIPYKNFDKNEVYKYVGATQSVAWKKLADPSVNLDLCYSPLVDGGRGNIISVGYLKQGETPSNTTDFREALQTQNLPYWYSTWGQNISWDFGVDRKSSDTGTVTWIHWMMPEWTATKIEHAEQKPQWSRFCAIASTARVFAQMGWFVQQSVTDQVQIPILYRSYWKWGGTQLTKQPITALFPTTNQISVKNPSRVGESIIRPGDLRNGLLTADALRRFLQPSKFSDERRPEPFEEQPKGYASSEEYDETGSEAEESEEECTEKSDFPAIIQCLSKRVQRERAQRRSLHKFFKSLLIK